MSPEKAKGDRYGPPDDVWALGCILAELMQGHLIGGSGLLALNNIKIAETVRASKQAHAQLGSWVEGCLQQQPGQRCVHCPSVGSTEPPGRSAWTACFDCMRRHKPEICAR